jgi:hypothetical protein
MTKEDPEETAQAVQKEGPNVVPEQQPKRNMVTLDAEDKCMSSWAKDTMDDPGKPPVILTYAST